MFIDENYGRVTAIEFERSTQVQSPEWDSLVGLGIRDMLKQLTFLQGTAQLDKEHVKDTPSRFVKALREFFEGCNQDPTDVLRKSFEEAAYDQMVFVNSIQFNSMCMHHLVPFVGRAHFAYIPKGKIVGLSKIARMIDILSHRPQVQERLTQEIVEIFDDVVEPAGCGAVLEAYHFCMCVRGVKKVSAFTRTSALKGIFLTESTTKSEFLAGAKGVDGIWL